MLNTVRGLQSIFDSVKVVLEFLCEEVLFFLSTDDIRVLVSLRALMTQKPLRKIEDAV